MAFRFLIFFLLFSSPVFSATYKIVCVGDSLTEGLGVAKNQAYPKLLEDHFHKSGLKNIEVINSGVSGATTASLASKISWVIKSKPQMVILAMGANDGLRGFSVTKMKENLVNAISKLKESGISVILIGMRMPPNYGAQYVREFDQSFKQVSTQEKVFYVPFLLEGVAAQKEFNQPDGIHPNEKGYEVIALNIFKKIEKKVKEELAQK